MHTERGLDRLVNFSDAVVAIAMTLLVLPLVDLPRDLSTHSIGEVLRESSSVLFGFALSFIVIARFWRGHHRMFEGVRDYNEPLVWLNLTWLLTIVVTPFTTALIADSARASDSSTVDGVYLLNLTLSSLLLALMELLIRRNAELRRSPDHPITATAAGDARDDEGESRVISVSDQAAPSTTAELFVQPVLFAVATVLAATLPSVRMWAALLLFLNAPVSAWIRWVTARRPAPGSARGPDR